MRQLETQLEDMFSGKFRRIWVQRSKYSVCLTLFPIEPNSHYKIVTRREVLHGMSEEIPLDLLVEMVGSLS